jgi:hypothetical protein
MKKNKIISIMFFSIFAILELIFSLVTKIFVELLNKVFHLNILVTRPTAIDYFYSTATMKLLLVFQLFAIIVAAIAWFAGLKRNFYGFFIGFLLAIVSLITVYAVAVSFSLGGFDMG